jgi:hypothetical protein
MKRQSHSRQPKKRNVRNANNRKAKKPPDLIHDGKKSFSQEEILIEANRYIYSLLFAFIKRNKYSMILSLNRIIELNHLHWKEMVFLLKGVYGIT